jgi:aconitate hydratase
MPQDFFNTRDHLKTSQGNFVFYRLDRLESAGLTRLASLPFSVRVLLESVLRQCNEREIRRQDVINLAGWKRSGSRLPVPFAPARVLMQDFTGVPAVVDLAAMRAAMAHLGGDPKKINPLVPVDLVIDHSVQVDFYRVPDALTLNAGMEFQRNRERYEFLHWGEHAFDNFRVVPPATGICHQINLEYLAQVVMTKKVDGQLLTFPDTLVGTDSHTTMVNGLGVLGWGVGGIEGEAAMLGQPIDMLAPDVIGFKLYGKLSEGATATDLTLTITQMLRKKGVVEKFVEFYGPGLSSMSLPDRATIANMAPEYGATCGFFPVDDETLRYLRLTGRPQELLERVERYTKEQGLFRTGNTPDPEFTDTLELDLGAVESSLAGPKRPQDRLALKQVKPSFRKGLTAPLKERGYQLTEEQAQKRSVFKSGGTELPIEHGAVVIAAITSCTNTSNPSVMVAAGLLAKKAIEHGLQVKPYVKTSLAPGSRVVTDYLRRAGLIEPLETLGFGLVGYGCTTCIGNSGPLSEEVVKAIGADIVAAAVLSGNRNFEGRIHPYVRANYLASPPLVVAYALAGTVDIDLTSETLGHDSQGRPVYLRDLWPSQTEIQQTIAQALQPEMFVNNYAHVFSGNATWNQIPYGESELYSWDPASTYIQEPPFFAGLQRMPEAVKEIKRARMLALLGDSITTDHISPAGSISPQSPAGKFLVKNGIQPLDFNSYGARRGNDRVMVRGTFANIRLKNLLLPGTEGGNTLHFPDREKMSIYDAAVRYRQECVPLIVMAGKEYGAGSSRDWAAKGTLLLGVRAVIAESFERIHRSNLVGMGVLPLQFKPGQNPESLGLDGSETFSIRGLDDRIQSKSELEAVAEKEDGTQIAFKVDVRLETAIEVEYYRNGGILQTVLRSLL